MNFLINFIEIKMNASSKPFKLLYKIMNKFCNSAIFEILAIQSRTIQLLSSFIKITLTYWINFYTNKRPFKFVISEHENSEILLSNEPDLPQKDLTFSNETNINFFTIISEILDTRTSIYFTELYEKIKLKFQPSPACLITCLRTSLLFKPSTTCSELYYLHFKLNQQTGELITEGSIYSKFINLKNFNLHTQSTTDQWIEFLKDYQRFALLYIVKSLISSYKSQWLKLIPSAQSDTCCTHSAISQLYADYSHIYLAYVSATSSLSLTIIGINFSEHNSVNYNIWFLNSLAHKSCQNEVRDIYIRSLLQTTYVYDLRFFQDLPFFKYENFKNYGLSKSIKYMIEKSELVTFISELRQIGWDNTFKSLTSQPSFRSISLRSFLLSHSGTSSTIFNACFVDANLLHDSFFQKWIVKLIFSSEYFNKISTLICISPIILVNISKNDFEPFDLIIKKWKSFAYCLENLIKLTYYKEILNKIDEIYLNFDGLKIIYGGPFKFVAKLEFYNKTPSFTFYSYSGHTNPHSNKNALIFIHRYYQNRMSIVKLLNMIVNTSLKIKKLLSIRSYVCLGPDLHLTSSSSYMIYYQISTVSFNIRFRNWYFFFKFLFSFSINVLFLENDMVQISGNIIMFYLDNAYTNIWRDTSLAKSSIIPLNFLSRFLCNKSFICYNSCYKTQTETYIINYSVWDSILSSINIPFPASNHSITTTFLHIFFESCFLLRSIASFYHLPLFDQIKNSLISFNLGPFTIVLGFSMNIHRSPLFVYLNIISTESDLQLDPISQIISYEYKAASVVQYLTLLKLNFDFIKDFSYVLKLELNENFDDKWIIRWRHLPSSSLPFRLLPIHSFSIFQVTKCMIMIDFISKKNPNHYLTTLLLWNYNNKKIQDVHVFGSTTLSSKSNEIKSIHYSIKDKIKEVVIKTPNISLSIEQIVQISFSCIKSSEKNIEI
ncbi:hypothetical protein HZS_6178 [Henneguya salminicola]|nr:hypothetical protein HZS_6178 [Henneguya salminicola]